MLRRLSSFIDFIVAGRVRRFPSARDRVDQQVELREYDDYGYYAWLSSEDLMWMWMFTYPSCAPPQGLSLRHFHRDAHPQVGYPYRSFGLNLR